MGGRAAAGIIEVVWRAIDAEGDALQRAGRDDAVFQLLEVLRHRRPDVFRCSRRCARYGLFPDTCALIKVSPIESGATEVPKGTARTHHSRIVHIFGGDFNMTLALCEAGPCSQLERRSAVVLEGASAVARINLDAVEFLISHKVDHTRDRIRSPGGGRATSHDVHALY